VFGGGGGFSSSPRYNLGSTAGQPGPIGLSSGTNYQLQAGFWYGAGACNPTNGAGDHDLDTLTTGVETGTHGTDPCLKDTDADACSDGEEVAPNEALGGDRDPLSQWDFFDVPVPALSNLNPSSVRSKAIGITDVLAILFYSGTTDNGPPINQGDPDEVDYDSDLNGNGIEDGAEYDRSPSSTSGKLWRSGPPSSAVGVSDALIALAQAGHSCVAPP
jgi:hypothetical protein